MRMGNGVLDDGFGMDPVLAEKSLRLEMEVVSVKKEAWKIRSWTTQASVSQAQRVDV